MRLHTNANPPTLFSRAGLWVIVFFLLTSGWSKSNGLLHFSTAIEVEGYELAKALLMMHQKLYTAVWWDQPPVHAGILHTGAVLFGSGVHSFRLVAGFLCAASLWALAACASSGRQREGGSGLMSGSGASGWLPSAAPFLPHPGPLPLGEGESSCSLELLEGLLTHERGLRRPLSQRDITVGL